MENHQAETGGFFRSLLLWSYFLPITAALAILSLIFSFAKMPSAVHRVGRIWANIMNRAVGTKLQVTGSLPVAEGPIVYLCNHRSIYDIIVLFVILKHPVRWVAKESLFRIPVFGHALKGAGHIPVIRDNKKKALQSLFRSVKLLEQGNSILLFPEGTRNKIESTLLPFKKGAFVLAKKGKARVQPIVLKHTASVIPPRQSGKWIQRISRSPVEVHFLDPILPEEVQEKKTEELSEMVYQRMARVLADPIETELLPTGPDSH